MKLNPKQEAAQSVLAGDATHIMLFGGSRSGKTFLLVRNTIMRALKAPASRHLIVRFRFNHVKNSIVLDTFPKVMRLAFPGVKYTLSKTDWYAEFENGAQIWFGGLDDKERTEKILGQEYVTIYLNECSQIPFGSVGIAVTRLAQKVSQVIKGAAETLMKPRMYYDCNPPSKAHWAYQIFVQKRDPDTSMQTEDNAAEVQAGSPTEPTEQAQQPASEVSTEPGAGQTAEQVEQQPQQQEKPKNDWVQRRIDQLTREKHEETRRISLTLAPATRSAAARNK